MVWPSMHSRGLYPASCVKTNLELVPAETSRFKPRAFDTPAVGGVRGAAKPPSQRLWQLQGPTSVSQLVMGFIVRNINECFQKHVNNVPMTNND